VSKVSEGGPTRTDAFDERERAFEAKYRHDEEIAFKADARCAHLFGLWVAGRLGLAGAAAEDYSKTVREADLIKPQHRAMFAKALADLVAKGIAATEAELAGRRETLLEEAKKQIVNELAEGRQHLEPGL